VRQTEHFFPNCSILTCCAAPIFDPQGVLLGALDITTRSQQGQQYALVLVNGAAQRIENRLLDLRYRDAYPIHFHSRAEMVHTLHEGRLVVASDGSVQAANRRALSQLGYRTVGDVTSRKVQDLFGADLREMLERSFRNSFHPVPTYRDSTDKPFFIVVQQPVTGGAQKRSHAIATSRPRAPAPDPDVAFEFGDPRIADQLAMARRIVERRIPILIYGETGVGKEVFARALHRVGPLADGEFVVLDCAALGGSALDDVIDTAASSRPTRGSRSARQKTPLAARGTLFLDEIGHLSADAQARLLHKLDSLCAARDEADLQIVAASHCRLGDLVARGDFRDDLYYRLCGLEITMPPLRERSDIGALVRRMLHDEIGAAYELDPEAERLLVAYAWPGNVRQLHHVLQAAAALADGMTIKADSMPSLIVGASQAAPTGGTRQGVSVAPEAAADDPRAAMLRTLEHHRWNVSRVAETLGISRNTLYRRLHRLGIDLSH
jgi:transcriptional regulator of acetoin/glycerol metabolism